MERFGSSEVHQFRAADLIAEKWGLDGDQMAAFAAESHRRAAAAREAGFFDREILPVDDFTRDETIRPDTTAESALVSRSMTSTCSR